MKTYCYVLTLDPRLYEDNAWTEEDHQAVERHFLRLKKDFEAGKLMHVGRTDDPTHGGFGLVIFKAMDDEDANRYMEEDPAIIGKLMKGSCFLYRPVFHQK